MKAADLWHLRGCDLLFTLETNTKFVLYDVCPDIIWTETGSKIYAVNIKGRRNNSQCYIPT